MNCRSFIFCTVDKNMPIIHLYNSFTYDKSKTCSSIFISKERMKEVFLNMLRNPFSSICNMQLCVCFIVFTTMVSVSLEVMASIAFLVMFKTTCFIWSFEQRIWTGWSGKCKWNTMLCKFASDWIINATSFRIVLTSYVCSMMAVGFPRIRNSLTISLIRSISCSITEK